MGYDWESVPSLADQDEYLTTIYYGEPGSGKSSAAVAGLSRLGPTLVVDAEGGLKRRALIKRGTVLDEVRVLPKAGQRISYAWLESLYFKLEAEFEKEGPGLLSGIVWDTGSQIAQTLLDETRTENTEKAARANKPRSPFQTELQDHGMNTDKMRSLLRKYRTLPCHFVICSHERRDQDDDGRVRYGPAVGPALQNALMELADVVVHLEPSEVAFEQKRGKKVAVGPVVYKALTGAGTKYLSKDRFDCLPRHLVDPYFDRILGYVEGKLDETTDDLQQSLAPRPPVGDEPDQKEGD